MGRRVLDRRRGLAGWIIGALLASSLVFQGTVSPNTESASAALAAETTACNAGYSINTANLGSYTSGDGIKIEPLHTRVLYVDPRSGFDATYIGYRVSNTSTTAYPDMYLGLEFSDPLIQPVSDADKKRAIPLAAKSGSTIDSKIVYFMVRATNVSEGTEVRHQVRLFDKDPDINGTRLAGCYFPHQGVQRSLAASANKVTSIETNAANLSLGSTFTVTVRGVPGTVGAGNGVDGSVFALSPAVNKSWPTKAIRLQNVVLDVSGTKSGNGCTTADTADNSSKTAQWVNKLSLGNASACFTNKSTYVAT